MYVTCTVQSCIPVTLTLAVQDWIATNTPQEVHQYT